MVRFHHFRAPSSQAAPQSQVLARALPLAIVMLAQLAWFVVPAADFDEALYAENARIMALTHSYAQPMWDGRAMFDKPPVFMWLLTPLAQGYDAGGMFPGLIRLPSIIMSWLLMIGVGFVLKRSNQGQHPGQGNMGSLDVSQGALLYAAALLPCLGSGLLLIDVLLSLLLLPVFVTIDSSIRHAEQGRVRPLGALGSLAAGLGMAGATATKGLIGLVIPGLATLVAVLWLGPWREAGVRLVAAVRAYAAMSLIALAGALGFYSWLWLEGHQDFVRDFFVVHHFSRGSSAMEGHGGSVFYHPIVVFLGGGVVSALALNLLSQQQPARPKRRARELDFPLIWIASTVAFFSFMATKLPNYTWPCWMALPFALVRLCSNCEKILPRSEPVAAPRPTITTALERLSRMATGLLAVILVVAGVAVCLVPIVLSLGAPALEPYLDPRASIMVTSSPMQATDTIGCLVVGGLLVLLARLVHSAGRAANLTAILLVARRAALVNSALFIALIFGLGPWAKRTYLDPILAAADMASQHFADHRVMTFGIRSPTFSSRYRGQGTIKQVGANSTADMDRDTDSDAGAADQLVLVLPLWAQHSCPERGATLVKTIRWLQVCERP